MSRYYEKLPSEPNKSTSVVNNNSSAYLLSLLSTGIFLLHEIEISTAHGSTPLRLRLGQIEKNRPLELPDEPQLGGKNPVYFARPVLVLGKHGHKVDNVTSRIAGDVNAESGRNALNLRTKSMY